MQSEEWIGVEEVAAEMKYDKRTAWEYLRTIGLASANARKIDLVRFTRADFIEARRRAMAPISPRARSGAIVKAAAATSAKKPAEKSAESFAARVAKMRKA